MPFSRKEPFRSFLARLGGDGYAEYGERPIWQPGPFDQQPALLDRMGAAMRRQEGAPRVVLVRPTTGPNYPGVPRFTLRGPHDVLVVPNDPAAAGRARSLAAANPPPSPPRPLPNAPPPPLPTSVTQGIPLPTTGVEHPGGPVFGFPAPNPATALDVLAILAQLGAMPMSTTPSPFPRPAAPPPASPPWRFRDSGNRVASFVGNRPPDAAPSLAAPPRRE